MDSEIEKLIDEYRQVNNEEREGDLAEIAQRIQQKQQQLIEEEGHSGLGEVN